MSYFWGIGVGPGDSDLITIKAVKAIKKLQILYVPAAHGDSPSLAESIAKPYFSDNLVIKKRHFPMVNNL
ncbi:precorrin-2 C(20)-methyltransferase, partial [Lactobacillus sp. XV13L]|nr:precorrin-2 C(20)-methyltransferase [Lactobacillus sp. XV13L]